MDRLTRVSAALDKFVVGIGRGAACAGLLLVLVTITDVFLRTLTQSSWEILREFSAAQQKIFGSTQLQELEWHLHTVLFMFCLGYAYIKGAHVRIDLVRERLGPRTRAVIEIIGIVFLLLPFCALIITYGIDFVAASFSQHEGSASGGGLGHRWIIKATLPAGIALLALSGIASLLRNLCALTRREQTVSGDP
jgi:TRAP-type mannitol/chloroaromatic compound transport system permease small subunit